MDQDGFYTIKIVVRDGQGRIADDYHATVTRFPDGVQLIFISRWKWLVKWRTRTKALDRAFEYNDKRAKKLAEVETVKQ